MQTDSSIFIDTWGWLALGHRADNYHQAVKEVYQHLRQTQAQIHTSDYVLDELISLLFRRELFQEATGFTEGIFAATEQGQLQIHRVTSQHFALAWGLRKRFQDKPLISFTDYVDGDYAGARHRLGFDPGRSFSSDRHGFVKIP